jgi:hypothetical protein
VSEHEVVASHQRKDRHGAHPLLRKLLATDQAGQGPGPAVGNNGSPPQAEAAGNGRPAPVERPALDELDLCQFIIAQLGQTPEASSQVLALKYVEYVHATRRVQVDVAACQPRLEAVARKMHRVGLVHATPGTDGLYLLSRKR